MKWGVFFSLLLERVRRVAALYTTNAEIFDKKPDQTFPGLNLKAEDYSYLSKLWNISS